MKFIDLALVYCTPPDAIAFLYYCFILFLSFLSFWDVQNKSDKKMYTPGKSI